mgnify:CR=1 FL=1
MQPLEAFQSSSIQVLFTDIDDTLTDHGRLMPHAYEALWRLHKNGIHVIPVTGRPAGWCEMIARFWPVHGVVGENGGFYFRYHDRRMIRHYVVDEATRAENHKKLERIRSEILNDVQRAAVASDQFARVMDLAIDFAEDVGPLSEEEIDKIVTIFKKHGAQAKVSSIHVNGWFGRYDKLSTCKIYVQNEFGLDLDHAKERFAFSGDSPNDEPMFAYFENSFAVANIRNFLSRLNHRPAYVASREGGAGFVEIADRLIELANSTK